MPLDTLENDSEKIYDDHINKPYLNRTIAQPYQPGSTIKPFMLVSAVSAGVHQLGTPILCNGYLHEGDPTHYRCWIFKQYMLRHGLLKGAEAIARSCNVFFYTLGEDMGPARVGEWYGKFGLGRPTGLSLPDEVAGDLPDPEASRAGKFNTADAIFMGIGQGPVRWTPMQAAGAYATLIRKGLMMEPTLIADSERPRTAQTTSASA